MLEQMVASTIAKYGLLEQGGGVIVGVSGGTDSVCLLHVLWKLSKAYPFQIEAVHVHHGIRGEQADADCSFTEALCEKLEIPCTCLHYDVTSLAKKAGLTVEEMGRELRYAAFHEAKEKLEARLFPSAEKKAVRIAVAHHRNDQVETILMRILRGTGVDGLAGMEFLRADGIIRPLLNRTRTEIETYCKEEGLTPQTDLTNFEVEYTRNRIRIELLPYLQQQFNPNVVAAIARLAESAAEDRAFLNACTEQAIERIKIQSEPCAKQVSERAQSEMHIDREGYALLPAAIRKRVIMKLLKAIGMKQDLSAVHLEQADALIREGATGSQMPFSNGFSLHLLYKQAAFFAPMANNAKQGIAFCYPLEFGEATRIPECEAEMRVRIVSCDDPLCKSEHDLFRVCLSIGSLMAEDCLVVRTRRSGDWIRPSGMDGTKKLQDFFVDQKIPKKDRDHIPLVCKGMEVLWVVGIRVSENGRVKNEEESAVCLEYHKLA